MSQNRMKKVCDIIIPVHNSWHTARPCIDSVFKHSNDILNHVFLIDDGSDFFVSEQLDRIKRTYRGKVSILSNSKSIGFVRSCNMALRVSRARVIVVLSCNTFVAPGWLSGLFSAFEADRRVGIISPLANNAEFTNIPMLPGSDLYRMTLLVKEKSKDPCSDIPIAERFCFALSSECLASTGYLDEMFQTLCVAVNDYSQRAQYFGFRVVCAHNAYIFHKKTPPCSKNMAHSCDLKILNRRWKNRLALVDSPRETELLIGLRDSINKIRVASIIPQIDGTFARKNMLEFLCVLPTLNPYGGVISIVNLMNHLMEMGHGCTMVSLSRCDNHPHTFYAEPTYIKDWNKIPEQMKGDYDVLIATSWETVGAVVELAKSSRNGKSIYFIQDIESVFYNKDDYRRREVIKTYGQIETRIVKTKFLQNALRDLGCFAERIRPGMNLDLFYPHPKPNDNVSRVLAMARIGHSHRGDDLVLETMEKLVQKKRGVEITLFGSNDLSDMKTSFPFVNKGRVNPEDLPSIYSSADVYVEMSREHGFGRTGVEAMACGTACVLSDSGGIREYARHEENALIVQVGDVDGAVQQICRLLDDHNLRSHLIEAGLKTVQKFAEREAAKDFLAIVDKAINRAGAERVSLVAKTTQKKRENRIMLSEETKNEFAEKNPLRRILVNSIPKSGTTWVKTMLSLLPGYEEFPMNGFSGTSPEQLLEVKPGQVFHGHIMSSERLDTIIKELNFATVFVYRDLRDVVISNYFHYSTLNPKRAPEFFKGKTKEELLNAESLVEWCPPCKRYPDVRMWVNQDIIPTVTYETLKKDTVCEMRRVLDKMGFLVNDQIVQHIVKEASFQNLSGRTPGNDNPRSPQRKGIVGDWKSHFSESNKERFKAKFGHLLIEFGYEKNMNW